MKNENQNETISTPPNSQSNFKNTIELDKFDVLTIKTTADLFDETIKDKNYFGWQLDKNKSDKRVAKKNNNGRFFKRRDLTFTRTKNIGYHDKLVELEKKYNELEGKKKEYTKGDPVNAFFLFLLAIVPGIIYVCYKSHKKKKIKKYNESLDREKEKYLIQAQEILEEAKVPYKKVATKIQYSKPSISNPYNSNRSGVQNKKETPQAKDSKQERIPFTNDK